MSAWIKSLIDSARGLGFVVEAIRPGGVELVDSAGGKVSITTPLLTAPLMATILAGGSPQPAPQCPGRVGNPTTGPRCESYLWHAGGHFVRPKPKDDDD